MEMNVTSPSRLNSTIHDQQFTDSTSGQENGFPLKLEAIFGVIAILSFALNTLFVVVMTKKSDMLKIPHNILLFSLSITDMLTGIFLPLTPGYVIPFSSFPVPGGIAGEIFCRLLASRYLLFTMGKISILKVTCLAVERWYCVFRPITYKHYFNRKRLFAYVTAIWVSTCLLQINKFFEWSLSRGKCSPVKAPYSVQGTQAMIITYSLVGFYIPCVIAWASFAHVTLLFKTSPIARCYGKLQRKRQKVLLRMCALACIVLTLCWLPAQTIYVLSPFGITRIGSPMHKLGGVLAMFNSCVNPIIYWTTNKEYRDGLRELLVCYNPCKTGSYDLEMQTYSKRVASTTSLETSVQCDGHGIVAIPPPEISQVAHY